MLLCCFCLAAYLLPSCWPTAAVLPCCCLAALLLSWYPTCAACAVPHNCCRFSGHPAAVSPSAILVRESVSPFPCECVGAHQRTSMRTHSTRTFRGRAKTTRSPNATARNKDCHDFNTMSVKTCHAHQSSAMPLNTVKLPHSEQESHHRFRYGRRFDSDLGFGLGDLLAHSSGSAALCHGCALYTAPAGNDWQYVDRAGTRAKPQLELFDVFYMFTALMSTEMLASANQTVPLRARRFFFFAKRIKEHSHKSTQVLITSAPK